MPKGNKKIIFLSPADAEKWYSIANLFAKSLLSRSEAIHEYNKVGPVRRKEIKDRFSSLDSDRRSLNIEGLSKAELDQHFDLSVFVDSHIVATEYDTDPVVVLMCCIRPGQLKQTVIVK